MKFEIKEIRDGVFHRSKDDWTALSVARMPLGWILFDHKNEGYLGATKDSKDEHYYDRSAIYIPDPEHLMEWDYVCDEDGEEEEKDDY